MDQLQANLQSNLESIRTKLGNSSDIVIRELQVGGEGEQRIALVYTDGLADQTIITDFIMESLLSDSKALQSGQAKNAANSSSSNGTNVQSAGTAPAAGYQSGSGSSNGSQSGCGSSNGSQSSNGSSNGTQSGSGSSNGSQTGNGSSNGPQSGSGSSDGSQSGCGSSNGPQTGCGSSNGSQSGSGSSNGPQSGSGSSNGSQPGSGSSNGPQSDCGSSSGSQSGSGSSNGSQPGSGSSNGSQSGSGSSKDLIKLLQERVLAVGDVNPVDCFDDVYQAVLSGNTVLLLDGYTTGLVASTQGWKDRGVVEATTEPSVRGSREAFSETLRTNTSLIRRRIKHPDLRLETKPIGRLTQTNVAIMFVQGIANDKVIKEVRERLNRIDIDGILESGYIEELIQDKTFTPFPTIYNTERPDVIAAELLEGKIAILIDGTPSVLVVPGLFVSFLHAAEDYYFRSDISSLVRILRYIGMFIALLGPSLYIAITTFHQEMLPTQLLISLAAQREGIPFPALLEAIMMEILFELLREAGIRMPRMIGPAVSIVGTLVIGSSAVDAGIVSAAMVIVVSTTAICSFVFPAYTMSNAFRMLRFPLMLLAASFGLFGVCIGLIAIVLHLCSLSSFGVPYMSPLAPIMIKDQKDTIFRFPHWAMRTRPSFMSSHNRKRQQPRIRILVCTRSP